MTMNESLTFEEPHSARRDSYRELVDEFQRAGETLVPFILSFPNDDFEAFLAQLEACRKGVGIPQGFVPHSTYWLVSGGTVVGVVNIRHSLTDALRHFGGSIGFGIRPSMLRQGFAKELLRRALVEARSMGMPEVLLTCNKENVGSARTILGNGGVLVSEEFMSDHGGVIQRYRIGLR